MKENSIWLVWSVHFVNKIWFGEKLPFAAISVIVICARNVPTSKLSLFETLLRIMSRVYACEFAPIANADSYRQRYKSDRSLFLVSKPCTYTAILFSMNFVSNRRREGKAKGTTRSLLFSLIYITCSKNNLKAPFTILSD